MSRRGIVRSMAQVRQSMTATTPRRIANWPLWDLPPLVRCYVMAVPLLAGTMGITLLRSNRTRTADIVLFLLLLMAAAVCLEASRRMGEVAGLSKTLLAAWWVAMAVLLPPVYVLVAPGVITAMTQVRVRKAVLHRRVFSAAVIGLSYVGAAGLFSLLPLSGAEGGLTSAPATWALAVGACAATAAALTSVLIALAVKGTEPEATWRGLMLDKEHLQLDALQVCVGVLVALVVGLAPVLLLITLPPVLLLQRALLHSQLTAAARTDPKTGLLNAVTWEREATSDIARARRTGQPVAALLLDIDHFKRVNDTYGHLVGDQVLRRVADALVGELRDGDHIGRFGGEEFAVLLHAADEAEARRAGERLRRRISELRVPVPDGTFTTVTVSVGVAVADDADRSVAELLAHADAGLYAAKAAGRDQISLGPTREPAQPPPEIVR